MEWCLPSADFYLTDFLLAFASAHAEAWQVEPRLPRAFSPPGDHRDSDHRQFVEHARCGTPDPDDRITFPYALLPLLHLLGGAPLTRPRHHVLKQWRVGVAHLDGCCDREALSVPRDG